MKIRVMGLLLAGGLAFGGMAQAARVAQFAPQGDVGIVEAVSVQFDQPVVAVGDDQQPAPMALSCSGTVPRGQGRWLDDRRWTFNFEQPLGPGVQCSVTLSETMRTLTGAPLQGKKAYVFRTGGPQILDMRPGAYTRIIDEDQVFALRFNGPVAPESLLARSHCAVEGLGESVPMRVIDGADRTAILDALYFREAGDSQAVQLLQCQRRLPADAKVRLVIGPGIAVEGGDASVISTRAQMFDYQVRGPFRAEFTCLRENANADCTPVSAVRVTFSAPIKREDARKIRLKTPQQDLVPAQDDDDFQGDVTQVRFEGPFPEKTLLTVTLPDGLVDDAGRSLGNAGQFPLAFRTAEYPPLAKFAASPFGVIERFAEAPQGGSDAEYPPLVPMTVRNVEAGLATASLTISAGELSQVHVQGDVEVLEWYSRLRRLEQGGWTARQLDEILKGRTPQSDDGAMMDVRGVSVLAGRAGVERRVLPSTSTRALRPFEVIGIPMTAPGFHVLEIASPRLGRALLGDQQTMYVRTGALVTNLAVQLKKGRDDLLAWVTTLDEAKVVEGAQVVVLDCNGAELARGKTGVNGVWHWQEPLDAPDYCPDTGLSGVYVSARIDADHPLARGKADFSFAFSDWDRGIESWRFNLPTNFSDKRSMAAHTVFDRTLFRLGETVSMKHIIRDLTRQGMALPDPARLPDRVLIMHGGSGQQYEFELQWQETPSGGLTALSQFDIPRAARLGTYTVVLRDGAGSWHETGEFRVEEFKLPVLKGTLQISGDDAQPVLVAPRSAKVDMQLSYVAGGAAADLPVQVSAVARDDVPRFNGYDDFSFQAPDADSGDSAGAGIPAAGQRLFLDKAAVRLDAAGMGQLTLDTLPTVDRPQQWRFEASFLDPNGLVQTLSQAATVWPAAVQAGIRVNRWVQAGDSSPIQVVALSAAGQPQEGVAMTVVASTRTVYSTRKRLVGGFYSYESYSQTRMLGKVCEGRTDARGMLHCAMEMNTPGEIQFIARATDGQGRSAAAETSVWVTGTDDLWFGGDSADRIDLLSDRKSYAPGDTAEFQVRMPFRQAIALLAVEREGVLGMQVVELDGKDPTVRLTIRPEWGPNAYVSVLAVRGRLRQTPWYSFFSWGWHRPVEWYQAFRSNDQGYAAPTPFVDLAKPAFRYGLTEIRISDTRDQLLVQVTPEKAEYHVRDVAKVGVQVQLPDGRPAAHATVAFAAVDQALLELAPNASWDLLEAMRQRRSHGVQTATTQLEVVGRRHYGRKALPAGGGGGASPTRELLDTLLLWEPEVALDAQGRAVIDVPLNDAITQFALVAIADYGDSRFGTGKATIVAAQDLQVIAGLPALVREGDAYQALVTVRNATRRAMQIELEATYELRGQGHPGSLPLQRIELPAGAARTAVWPVQVPDGAAQGDEPAVLWRLQAREVAGDAAARSVAAPASGDAAGSQAAGSGTDVAQDTLLFTQQVIASVPVRTFQSVLVPLDGGAAPSQLQVAAPAGALVDDDGSVRGGLRLALRAKLAADGLDGVREWFKAYPYTCTEQLASRAIGLHDSAQWDALMRELPGTQDADGLVAYFPGMRQGSEVLTAYLLSASHEARTLGLPFAIPSALEQSMLDGLRAFVQGRIVRSRWAPQQDLTLRKLAGLDALSRYGVDVTRMLDSITPQPEQWPSSAVIDWWQVLQRTPQAPSRAAHMRKAEAVLRARLLQRGNEVVFSEAAPAAPWWLMASPQTELARLLMAVSGQAAWAEDAPRLAQGLLNQRVNGAWRTTTENLLGTLALEKFSRQYERRPVSGTTRFSVGQGAPQQVEWGGRQAAAQSRLFVQPWPPSGAQDALSLQHAGAGRVWAEVSAMAAVPRTEPVMAGMRVQREVLPLSQAVPGQWSVGDVYRVRLYLTSQTGTSWAVVNDPVPAGATILGSGMGRDSVIDSMADAAQPWTAVSPSFVERAFEGIRAYYEYLPSGETMLEYTVRLSTPGDFHLPGTRVEALYQPDVYGALPDTGRITVGEGLGGQ